MKAVHSLALVMLVCTLSAPVKMARYIQSEQSVRVGVENGKSECNAFRNAQD